MALSYSTAVLLLLGLALAWTTHAGYVDLYSDVNFQHRRTRVTDIAFDTCYSLTKCEAVDNHVMSAKWSGLPDTGTSKIVFYSSHNCVIPTMKFWNVSIQSDANPNFPTNFQLDGMADLISSFNVRKLEAAGHLKHVCAETENGQRHHHGDAITLTWRKPAINAALMNALNLQRCILASILLIVTAQASWVELYRDADHKHKLSRVEDIGYDQCYSFACKKLNNAVTSAKWGGLTEKTVDGGDAMIAFYIDRDCLKRNVWWRIKTQSDDDLHFPSNFRLDGINDEVSAFMVWHESTKKISQGRRDICATESGEIPSGSGNGTFGNDAVTTVP